ncbi:carbohydrate kinase family protein [Caldimonas thermodepolymerans]|jgi:adenosine kinase|uniref:Carbohydrate kinase family protein n=1 Tax=Caldimonas thermodepolymerans TaxID=215580 RepID=A0A2S5T3H0_9BURK|nr:carbohydrate kinase family protein [Caldimonas thermodepolymerans]PPE69541.1 carbohydrate kinase family protein [Caldimonas thermodepolymerans]QPC30943.1 carbohydrate kinase family protein [Caldimonas thermodepolymerans]RDH97043.1 adenosine kinase [Caldimonas thermodepolymerans]UZG43685.1 carbohydrate kinase family protein [Caldimonas thermodepolymerans]
MPALICGSLAFDTITTFPGRFQEQILPEQIHILNVSFLVPTLRREFGGCAGNIAYTLKQLGGEPLVMAALGADGQSYLDRMREWGVSTEFVQVVGDSYTAQAIIMTDADNNQITAFHPGAMQFAHRNVVQAREDIRLAIIAPDGRDAMLQHAEQLAAAGIPFVFDPGQGLPMFNGDELRRFVAQATWVAVNDYEARLLCERTGSDLAELSRSHLQGIIVTLGAHGCEVWTGGEKVHVPGVTASAVVDPTGCGDAFRGALLYGLERGWDLVRCAELGNRVGAIKIACAGPQNHRIDRAALGLA